MFSPVDSNDSLRPRLSPPSVKLPWVEERFPAKTKGAFIVVCTSTLKLVKAKEIVLYIKQFQS